MGEGEDQLGMLSFDLYVPEQLVSYIFYRRKYSSKHSNIMKSAAICQIQFLHQLI